MKRYVLIMSCLLLCACAFGDVADDNPVVGKVGKVVGGVWWMKEGKDPEKDLKKAAVGAELRQGDLLATDNSSTAQVDFLDGTVMKIGEMSRCVIRKKSVSAKKPTKLHLFGGKVRVKVGAGKVARGVFQVTTPTAVAGVRGTDFVVDCPVGKVTKVVVFEGVVAVSSMMGEVAGVVEVPAKHSTNVDAATAPEAPVEVPADELAAMEADMAMGADAGGAGGDAGAAGAGGDDDEGEGEDEGEGDAIAWGCTAHTH
ncbi:FecR domain-containing protein, partial [Planctomycetota bacterium]